VIWYGEDGTETVLADTTEGYRVLETSCACARLDLEDRLIVPSHPPTYYLPPSALKLPLKTTPRSTLCEVSCYITLSFQSC
jgi:uncharacterized protein (DUF427 family)